MSALGRSRTEARLLPPADPAAEGKRLRTPPPPVSRLPLAGLQQQQQELFVHTGTPSPGRSRNNSAERRAAAASPAGSIGSLELVPVALDGLEDVMSNDGEGDDDDDDLVGEMPAAGFGVGGADPLLDDGSGGDLVLHAAEAFQLEPVPQRPPPLSRPSSTASTASSSSGGGMPAASWALRAAGLSAGSPAGGAGGPLEPFSPIDLDLDSDGGSDPEDDGEQGDEEASLGPDPVPLSRGPSDASTIPDSASVGRLSGQSLPGGAAGDGFGFGYGFGAGGLPGMPPRVDVGQPLVGQGVSHNPPTPLAPAGLRMQRSSTSSAFSSGSSSLSGSSASSPSSAHQQQQRRTIVEGRQRIEGAVGRKLKQQALASPGRSLSRSQLLAGQPVVSMDPIAERD
jgi:hypothetical protein